MILRSIRLFKDFFRGIHLKYIAIAAARAVVDEVRHAGEGIAAVSAALVHRATASFCGCEI